MIPKLNIPFSRVQINAVERRLLEEVLNTGWLTTAGKTLAFEQQFAQFLGVKFACAVNSCTAALHLGIDALGVQRNDKVFVPSMTFTASAEVIRYLDADPIFLDTEYGTNLITAEILEAAIARHPDVKYLILVHYAGQAADMDPIMALCRQHGIRILEDAAHAFPTRYKDQYIGSFGDITCFSFYANKTITTGEGGMLVTNDEAIYKRVKTMRLHGINRDIWDRFTSKVPSWEYDVVEAGFKYNMPDIAAAIGLGQLEQADALRAGRLRGVRYYLRELSDLPQLDLPICHGDLEDHAWHIFPIVLNANAPLSRNRFIELLAEAGVGTSVHYKPLHQMTYYRQRYGLKADDYPNAERTWQGNVSLPLFPTMSDEELAYVCATVRSVLEGS